MVEAIVELVVYDRDVIAVASAAGADPGICFAAGSRVRPEAVALDEYIS